MALGRTPGALSSTRMAAGSAALGLWDTEGSKTHQKNGCGGHLGAERDPMGSVVVGKGDLGCVSWCCNVGQASRRGWQDGDETPAPERVCGFCSFLLFHVLLTALEGGKKLQLGSGWRCQR